MSGMSNTVVPDQTLSTSNSNPTRPVMPASNAAATRTVTSAAGVSTQELLGGLANMKVGEMSLGQVNPNSFIPLHGSWNKVQVDAFMQSMQANPRATSNGSSLTAMMQQRGVLPQGQRVVGFFGGKFFTTNS